MQSFGKQSEHPRLVHRRDHYTRPDVPAVVRVPRLPASSRAAAPTLLELASMLLDRAGAVSSDSPMPVSLLDTRPADAPPAAAAASSRAGSSRSSGAAHTTVFASPSDARLAHAAARTAGGTAASVP